MRSASGRPPGARAARRVLLAVTSAVLAAEVMAGTASMATASVTGPASSPGEAPPGAPPFFAGIISDDSPTGFVGVVKIFDSTSGKATATVTVPGATQLFSLARLGDDQHFVVGSFDRDTCTSHLWTFAIDAAGQPGPVTPLAALPQFSGAIAELVRSADGTAMAFDGQICAGGEQIGLIHLAPGQPPPPITRWDIPPGAAVISLSLSGDGSVLGFTFGAEDENGDETFQAFTKRADAPAGQLLKGAHEVPGLGAGAIRVTLSPSGDQLYAETQTPPGQGPVTLSLISASTGALVRQITQLNDGGEDLFFPALALDNAGQHMLAYGQKPGPGHADVEEIDLTSGENASFTMTSPVVEDPLSTFAW